MSFTLKISLSPLSLADLRSVTEPGGKLALGPECEKLVQQGRDFLDEYLSNTKEAIYGINTGFGALYNKRISDSELEKLQVNLILSHACGMGDEVPPEIVRMMLALKVKSLAFGHSGVQLKTVRQLIALFNSDIIPVVYQQGSLGASGDLAPLAHMSLALIGKGEVYYKGKKTNAAKALSAAGLKPIEFRSKEALALLNGTQFMSAYGAWCVLHAKKLADAADETAALSLDAFDGRPEPFHESLQKIRPHEGQMLVAKRMRGLLKGSMLIKRKKEHVQDPYSFRCVPQVHGASRDVIAYAEKTIVTEINSVTDNPTLFPKEDLILSGGNFHGQPLALALDMLAIAIAELASISERRTYLLISGQRGLPPFLVKDAGLNSGFMIPQYTAASIVSQNKQLCTPASVDSIISSNGQEDHVSMGANAATKCARVVDNAYRVLSIELLNAAQALEFRRPAKTSPLLEQRLVSFRKKVPFIKQDVLMRDLLKSSEDFLRTI